MLPSVMISEAYIGLGSNLGNSLANLGTATALMRRFALDVQPSPVYRTSPQGFRNQPAFYNSVCRISTRLTPFELIERLLEIEAVVGRRRTFQNAPRILDLDVLFYNRLVIESPPLVLPHPRLSERLFVLRPLADIAPHIRHPVIGLTVGEMLRALGGQDDGMVEVAGTRAN